MPLKQYLVSNSRDHDHYASLVFEVLEPQFQRQAIYTLIVLKTLQFKRVSVCQRISKNGKGAR